MSATEAVNTRKRRKSGEGSHKEHQKKSRCQGKSYINNKNQLALAKQTPQDKVTCKCTYKCKDISFYQKLKIFTEYYDIGDLSRQYTYLMGLINVTGVNRRRHGSYEEPESSRRQASVYYSLPNGHGEIVQVCKKTFLDFHQITKRTVETLVKSKKRGDLIYVEKSGNKKKMRKYTGDDEKAVIDHMKSFPTDNSHYTRARSDCDYLSEDLDYNRMYLAFQELYPDTRSCLVIIKIL
ncbi:uncharacterized protein LOC111064096 [Nilaparvata lugens]|uniref:uncharacterized protein LOC111064096 n=1 Tax=Nilaparvata lugens TaxID=108931 RepID=UPI00193E5A4B|nr:uncharacterized protein LOC111064096 [Nilaparvata lugens]